MAKSAKTAKSFSEVESISKNFKNQPVEIYVDKTTSMLVLIIISSKVSVNTALSRIRNFYAWILC